jgi:putative ABC transport system permease protein
MLINRIGITSYEFARRRADQFQGVCPLHQSFTEERAQRLIEREFNLSTLPSLPPANTIVQGRWFDTSAQRESSVEQGIAKTLGLKLGDRLRFDVAGVPVETTITSIRKLDWGSMRVNFFVILDPATGATLPSTLITAFYLPPQKQELVNRMVRDYPNLTIVDVGSMVTQVQQVIGQVVSAVEFLFLFTLAAGVMVLAAAMLVSQHERAHESALLRALGATRAQLSNAQWVECVLVGGSAGLLAALGATAVGWVLAHQVLDVEWIFRPTVFLAGLAVVPSLEHGPRGVGGRIPLFRFSATDCH